MIQVQPYQAKIPIRGGGGGVSRIAASNTEGTSSIIEALRQIGQVVRQEKDEDLKRSLLEADLAYRRKATSILGQPKASQSAGRVVTGNGTTWLVDPRTGEKRNLGIPAPKSKASNELLNAWLKLGQFEEPTSEEAAIKGVLGERLMEQYGITGETPTTEIQPKADKTRPQIDRTKPRQYYPGGVVFPAQTSKQTPITKALQKTEKPQERAQADSVVMQAPDGKKYLVPAAEVKEAEKHGWKRAEAPAKKTTGKAGKSAVPEWLNLGKRATAAETAERLGVSKHQTAAQKAAKMGVKTGPRPGSVAAIAAAGGKTPTTTKEKTKKSKTVGKTGLTKEELTGLQNTGNFKLTSTGAISGVHIERAGGEAGDLTGAKESARKIATALSKTYPSAIGPKLTYSEILDAIYEAVYQESRAAQSEKEEDYRRHARTFGKGKR